MKKKIVNIAALLFTVVIICFGFTVSTLAAEDTAELTTPLIKEAVNRNGYIKLTWKKVKDANRYKIYKKSDNSSWKHLKTVKGNVTDFKDEQVEHGITYSYKTVALKGNKKSAYSKPYDNCRYLSPPQNITVSNTGFNGCYIKWDKVSGAKSYSIFRKDKANSSWQLIKTLKSTSYKDTTAKNSTEYTYAVRVQDKDNYMSYYSSGTKTTCLYKPKKVSFICSPKGITVKWSKIPAGDGYKVYRKSSASESYKLIGKVSSRDTVFFTDTTALKGKNYIYTVRAFKGNANGCYEKTGYTVKYIKSPTLSIKHSPKGIVLNWSKSSVGTGYEIQRKIQGEDKYSPYAVIKNPNTTSFTDSKPVYGKYNYYRVKIVYEGCNLSNSQKLFGINPKKKTVALTYDDGPYSKATNSILNTLKAYNSRATFFVVGSRLSTYGDCIIRADKQGCEIGNHSFNHTYLTSVNTKRIKDEISFTNAEIYNLIGKTPKLVRTPGGSVNSTIRDAIDYPIINWSVDTLDWKYRNSDSVIASVKKDVRDGSIVLMHDLYISTAEATKEIIPWLIKNGYQLVTVSEMMAIKGVKMKAGTVYYSAKG